MAFVIYSREEDGVHCIAPDGELIGKIRGPWTVANITFGGPMRNRLCMAAASPLYAVYVGTRCALSAARPRGEP